MEWAIAFIIFGVTAWALGNEFKSTRSRIDKISERVDELIEITTEIRDNTDNASD